MKKKKQEPRYTSIQLTTGFKEKLRKVKDAQHIDNYENVIKHIIKVGDKDGSICRSW